MENCHKLKMVDKMELKQANLKSQAKIPDHMWFLCMEKIFLAAM